MWLESVCRRVTKAVCNRKLRSWRSLTVELGLIKRRGRAWKSKVVVRRC